MVVSSALCSAVQPSVRALSRAGGGGSRALPSPTHQATPHKANKSGEHRTTARQTGLDPAHALPWLADPRA